MASGGRQPPDSGERVRARIRGLTPPARQNEVQDENTAVLLLPVALGACSAAAAADWPQWRGPKRERGVSQDKAGLLKMAGGSKKLLARIKDISNGFYDAGGRSATTSI